MKKVFFLAMLVSFGAVGTAKADIFVKADVHPAPGVRLAFQNGPVIREAVRVPERRVVWMRDYHRHRIVRPYYDRWDHCYRY